MSKRYRLDEVYGVTRTLPLNYVTRDGVDGDFVSSLATDKHIVVFGSSKQGKTSLRKHSLEDDDYIVVTCSNRWTSIASIHTAILKAAGYIIQQSTTRSQEGTLKITAKLAGSAGVPLFAKAKAAGELGGEGKLGKQVTTAPLELDPDDVNDIIAALDTIDFKKYIVLEDFHYLPDETQRDFAVALKAFHEHSPYVFVVVGVWLDQNRMTQLNGDLEDRVIAVDADAWSTPQLTEVISVGERLLDVSFDDDFKTALIAACFESVSLVQVACHKVCEEAGITASVQGKTKVVGEGIDAYKVIRGIVERQSGRYSGFLQDFASGFQETQLEMYRWLLLPVLLATPAELEAGLTRTHIRRIIDANHPEGPVNMGNITQALISTTALQVVKLRVKPIILDYDQTKKRLTIVDRGFLIWLDHQDRTELLAELDLPNPKDDQPSLLNEDG